MLGSKGLERDVKKTARCAVFSPRRVNRVSGANKGVRNACARRVAEQVPSTAPTEKTIMLSSFFSFSAKNDAVLPLISKNSFQTHLKNTDKSQIKKIDSFTLSIFYVLDYLYYVVIRIYGVGKFFLIILISALYSWFTM